MAHELAGLIKNALGVDQDFTDLLVKIVANCADDQAALLIYEESAALLFGGGFYRLP